MKVHGSGEPGLLITHESDPYNAEAVPAALADAITLAGAFYVRSHLPIPELDLRTWHMAVDGAVRLPMNLDWAALQDLGRERTVRVTLECAGNGRALMARRVPGTPWVCGATGTAQFTGTPLRSVLERAGLAASAVEIYFAGADEGEIEPGRRGSYARSLPRDVALHEDTLLAWAMNGEPLAREHGYPIRLVVPGWYGMASVKWLVRVTAMTEPFRGYYQTERYIYQDDPDMPDGTPVTRMRVRAVIARPGADAHLPLAPVEIAGTAWSGFAPISRVEISVNDGESWIETLLQASESPYAASPWRLTWTPPEPGPYSLRARAMDRAGNVQPLAPLWNKYGYGNNVAHAVHVIVG